MSRWWRAYDESLHNPKLLALPDRVHRAWFNLLCVASKNGGVLPSTATVAIELRVTAPKAAEYITALVAAELFDEIEPGKFSPHNWNARQYKSDVSTERVKRFRNAKRNVSETPPETENREQKTDAEKKETRASALAVGWPEDFREQFWAKYPNKVGKPKALAKLEAAMKRGAKWPEVSAGLDRYIREKPADRAWLNPETFINQERWLDQPANVHGNGNRNSGRAGEGDILAAMARGFGVGDGDMAGPADEDIPRGRFELDLEPEGRSPTVRRHSA
jgi:hypothetical protein